MAPADLVTRFRVSTSRTGRRRDVGVLVYDSVEELQRAATRYRGEGSFERVQAVSQPRFGERVSPQGTLHPFRGCGVVRLVKGQGAAILAHEMTHMALAIFREDMGRASLRNMKNEETLCHLVSDLVRSANRKMWKLGVYA